MRLTLPSRPILLSLATLLCLLIFPSIASGQPSSGVRPAYNRVLDEGTALPAQTVLNCVGSGIACTDDAINRRTVLTVSAGLTSVTINTTSPLGGGATGSTFTLTCSTCVTTGRTISTGNGLQGGGDLSANRTIDLLLAAAGGLESTQGGGGNELGIKAGGVSNTMLSNSSATVNTTSPLGGGGALALGGSLTLTCSTCVTTARSISAGTGLSGGGDLSSDRTLSLASGVVTTGTYDSVTVDTYGRVTAGTALEGTGSPTIALAVGSGLGTAPNGASVSIAGTDRWHTITAVCGTDAGFNQPAFTVTFGAAWGATPRLVWAWANKDSMEDELANSPVVTLYFDQADVSSTDYTWRVGGSVCSGTYKINVFVGR